MARVPRTDDVKVTSSLATGLVTAPLNAPAVMTVMDVRDSTKLEVEIDLIRGGTLTAVVMSVEEADAVGGPFSVVQRVDSAGVATDADITRTTSVTERFTFPVDVTPFQFIRLTLNGTGATAADTATVTANKTRGD